MTFCVLVKTIELGCQIKRLNRLENVLYTKTRLKKTTKKYTIAGTHFWSLHRKFEVCTKYFFCQLLCTEKHSDGQTEGRTGRCVKTEGPFISMSLVIGYV